MTRVTLMFLVVLSFGLASCGDDGGDGDPPATTTSAATTDFVAQADQICTEYLRDYAKAAGTPDGLSELAVASRKGRAVLDSSRERLAELDAPEAARTQYAEYLRSLGSSEGLLGDLEDAAGDKRSKRVTEVLQRLAAAAEKQRGLAQGAGLKVCGTQGNS